MYVCMCIYIYIYTRCGSCDLSHGKEAEMKRAERNETARNEARISNPDKRDRNETKRGNETTNEGGTRRDRPYEEAERNETARNEARRCGYQTRTKYMTIIYNII